MVVLSDIDLTPSATWEDGMRLAKRPALGIIVLVIFPLMNGVVMCVTLIFLHSTFCVASNSRWCLCGHGHHLGGISFHDRAYVDVGIMESESDIR